MNLVLPYLQNLSLKKSAFRVCCLVLYFSYSIFSQPSLHLANIYLFSTITYPLQPYCSLSEAFKFSREISWTLSPLITLVLRTKSEPFKPLNLFIIFCFQRVQSTYECLFSNLGAFEDRVFICWIGSRLPNQFTNVCIIFPAYSESLSDKEEQLSSYLISTIFCKQIYPQSNRPQLIFIIDTPVSFQPLIRLCWMGAAPRQAGSKDGCTTNAPFTNFLITRAGTMRPKLHANPIQKFCSSMNRQTLFHSRSSQSLFLLLLRI